MYVELKKKQKAAQMRGFELLVAAARYSSEYDVFNSIPSRDLGW